MTMRTTDMARGMVGSKRQVGRLVLRVERGPSAGLETEVEARRVTVGRSPVHDLDLDDPSVSESHFAIDITDEGLLLQDLSSKNGTIVSGVRVQQAWIEPGMLIEAGHSAVRVQSAAEVEVSYVNVPELEGILGSCEAMGILFAQLSRVGMTDLRVLLHGETGTGKELAARAIHALSPRRNEPFVIMDCGALSDELASSEILGHAKGAFTGATSDRAGKFEEADGGTLFLDEIGDLPLALQPKLLRVVERGEVIRVGENRVRPVDVRLVAATHRDIRSMAARGDFRQDLYFRIAAKTITLPPLRARKDDVVQLARRFVEEFSALADKTLTLAPDAVACLRSYEWPGNVRELRNAMEVAVSWATGDAIRETEVRMGQQDMAPPEPEAARERQLEEFLELPLKQAEVTFKRLYLTRVLERFDWNNAQAAKHIGYTREGVRGLRRKLGIEGPDGDR